MNKKKKEISLNWEEFKALGNPDAAAEEISEDSGDMDIDYSVRVRIYKDRKKRKGKTATLIKGLAESGLDLDQVSKDLKKHCGVGGSVLDGEIILLQGDQLQKALKFLKGKGFNDCKLSGV